MSDALITALVLGLAAGLWLIAELAPPVSQCVVDEMGVHVRLFGHFRLSQVRFEDIESVEIASWWDLLMDGTLRHASRVGTSPFRRPVVIRRRNGHPLLVAPRNQAAFLTRVEQGVLARGDVPPAGRLTSA